MNKKIEDLASASTPDGTEYLLITQGGNSRKILLSDLAAYIATAGSIVPSSNAWRGARARRSSTLSSLTSPVTLTWDSTSVDTDSFWSAGAPTRLTVPTGIQKVRLTWGIRHQSGASAGSVATLLSKNGTNCTNPDNYIYTSNREGTSGFTDNVASGVSGVLDVSAGDYFELVHNFSIGGSILTDSFFEIEVVEALP